MRDLEAVCDRVLFRMIDAMARTHGLTLASRRVRDFAHTGVKVVTPFESIKSHPYPTL